MGKLLALALAGLAFAAPAQAATVNVDPEPVHGTVTDTAGQIACGDDGNDCTGTYAGSVSEPGDAQLEATASPGYTFTGWTGFCESWNPDPTCTMVFTSNVTRTTSATFADQTAPTVALTAPTGGALFGPGSTVSMAASASDGTNIISRVDFILTKPGSASQTISDSAAPFGASLPANALDEGTWTIVARAFDGANNAADSASRSFTVDRTAPTLSVTGPAAFTATKPQSTGFTAGADAVESRCAVDGGSFGACSGASWHTTDFESGQHTVDVRVRDAAGNWSASQRATYTVDRASPDVSITSPSEAALTNADALSVAFTSDGTGSAITAAQCQLDGEDFVTCDSLTGHTFASPGDGTRTITVRVVDQAGNTRDATRTVTIDRTGPVVSITGPAAGSTVSADPVVVSFSSTDANGIATRMCAYDGVEAVACTGDGTHTVAGLAQGDRTFTLTVTDKAGNATTVTRSFRVERPSTTTTPPASEPGSAAPPADGGGQPVLAPARVAAIVQGEWRYRRAFTTILRLRVVDVPRGAAVEVRCKGRGCRFKRKAVKVRGATVNLISLVRKRKLRVNAVVEIRVTAPSMIGKVVRIKVRRGKRPAVSRLCLAPGARAPTRC